LGWCRTAGASDDEWITLSKMIVRAAKNVSFWLFLVVPNLSLELMMLTSDLLTRKYAARGLIIGSNWCVTIR
jgi:hypothetical protein